MDIDRASVHIHLMPIWIFIAGAKNRVYSGPEVMSIRPSISTATRRGSILSGMNRLKRDAKKILSESEIPFC